MDTKLKRTLSLFSLTFYGLGSIIGAGIYVIIGKVAYYAGMLTPLAFLLSSIIATFSALSFAELSSRYPKSAGEAVYVQQAFSRDLLTMLVGGFVVLTGIISTAALANGFVGYLQLFVSLPDSIIITVFILVLGLIAFWGIRESVALIVIITLIELGGLLLVIALASTQMPRDYHVYRQLIMVDSQGFTNIILGAFVAFYAFIGFEDIVNVAEEVKNPRKNVAWSLILSVIFSSIVYIVLAFFAVITLPLPDLITSKAPMAEIVARAGYSPVLIGIIGLITVINGALVNIIMASRVIYGMAKLNFLPNFFSNVHKKTQTPHVATIFIIIMILILALVFPILTLAKLTSFIMLIVYFFVNLSLIVIKLKHKKPKSVIAFPLIFPILGVLITLLFLALQFLI